MPLAPNNLWCMSNKYQDDMNFLTAITVFTTILGMAMVREKVAKKN